MRRSLLMPIVASALLLAVAPAPGGDSVRAPSERWCGGDAVATDRPDTVGGKQVHVLYAVPSDQPEAFGSRAPAIVTDLAAVDRWWRREDPAHTLRFDLAAFEGCDSELGRLDLTHVRLPHDAAHYADSPLRPILDDLAAEPFGIDGRDGDWILLVYYDGPVSERAHCGIGPILYLQTPFVNCGDDLGDANYKASTAAHALTHALGAVSASAPHYCGGAHVCDSADDLMYDVYNPGLRRAILDYGRDDYYGHSGNWPDAQDSPFLKRLDQPARQVVVTLAGSGPGRVVSAPVGIACPPACSSTWDTGAQLRLSPEEAERSRFLGWNGACSADDECVVTVAGPVNVTATFAALVKLKVHLVAKEPGAAGFVVNEAAGIDCPDECEEDVEKGKPLVLTVAPEPGSRFLGWSGTCGRARECTLALDADTEVTAFVGVARHRLVARVSGRGTVLASSVGVRCPSRCSAEVRHGTKVAVRAGAARGWRFDGWSGACRARRPCVVSMTADRQVGARFVRR